MFILKRVRELAGMDRVAATGLEGELSYAALDARSEALAAFLLANYPGLSPLILWGDKQHDILCGILAALKTGRPYVMVPDYYPPARVRQIAESCEPCAVFSLSEKPYPASGAPVYAACDVEQIVRQYEGAATDPELYPKPDDVICIFYTSGSTGAPKGVMVTRRNIEAMLDWWFPISDLGIDRPRVLNFASYGFCDSLMTIFNGMGMLGATLCSVDKGLSMDYARLVEYILKVDPHYLDCTPSFTEVCMLDPRFSSEGIPSMRQLSVGGEPCLHATARRLLERFPKAQIINGYGATETTIGPISCRITWDMVNSDKPIPIGYASFNSRIRIVDDKGNSVPSGEIGELLVISDMITPGYLKDPERTAKSYFTAEDGARGYRTRDLAWVEDDGLIYYAGRVDNMVKVGGYRVEMEEVEHYLSRVGAIARCAVVPAEEENRAVMLVAYVVLKPDVRKGLQTTIAIKKEMGQWVQSYMIPQKIVYLEELPYNSNGKIDRKLLREQSRIS